jgi:hypothetical protein
MTRITLFSFIFIFLLSDFQADAQRLYSKKYRYTSLGFNINAMNYVGDLDPSPGIFSPGVKYTRQNLGICILHKITPRLSLRGNISYGKIEASDAGNASYSDKDIYRKVRNLSFRNNIWELKADVVWDLFRFWGKYMKRSDYVPYLFTGLVFFHHNPQARTPQEFGGKWIDLQPLHLEGKSYSLNQIAIPVGMGFRYKINKNFDFAFEMGARFTFTDYLDDVSGSYAGREKSGDDPLKIAMADRSMEGVKKDPYLSNWVGDGNGYNNSNGYITINGYGRSGDQRGNPKRKDWYMITGFHLTYILPGRVKCPPKFQ